MKKQILSVAIALSGLIATQSFGMQQPLNNYFVYNNTPDATINIAGIGIAANVKNAQVKNSASDRIAVIMPNNMKMAFNAPGTFAISLAKLIDPQNPALPIYRLVLLNMLTAQIAMSQTLTTPGHNLTPEIAARLVPFNLGAIPAQPPVQQPHVGPSNK